MIKNKIFRVFAVSLGVFLLGACAATKQANESMETQAANIKQLRLSSADLEVKTLPGIVLKEESWVGEDSVRTIPLPEHLQGDTTIKYSQTAIAGVTGQDLMDSIATFLEIPIIVSRGTGGSEEEGEDTEAEQVGADAGADGASGGMPSLSGPLSDYDGAVTGKDPESVTRILMSERLGRISCIQVVLPGFWILFQGP